MKIGSVITKLRNKRGLTQDQMADILGVKRARYNSWENDIAKPDIEMLSKIALFHKVSTDYILGIEQEATNNTTNIDIKNIIELTDSIYYDGIKCTAEDKAKMIGVLEAIFWEAKKLHKDTK